MFVSYIDNSLPYSSFLLEVPEVLALLSLLAPDTYCTATALALSGCEPDPYHVPSCGYFVSRVYHLGCLASP